MPNLPDVATLANDLGGTLTNYEPVVDPNTDLDAGFDNNSRCNVAMMTHTACRAFAMIRWPNFATSSPVIAAGDTQWAVNTPGSPTLTRNGVGDWTLAYLSTVTDELAGTHTTNFRAARASLGVTTTVASWTNTASAVALNQLVQPTTPNGFLYYASTGGTKSISEPTWPTTIGNTVTDGSVVWTCLENFPTAAAVTATVASANTLRVRTYTFAATPVLVDYRGLTILVEAL